MSENREHPRGTRWEDLNTPERLTPATPEELAAMTPEERHARQAAEERNRLEVEHAQRVAEARAGSPPEDTVIEEVVMQKPREVGFLGKAGVMSLAVAAAFVPWAFKRTGYVASGAVKATDQLGLDLIKSSMQKSRIMRWIFKPLNFLSGGRLLKKPEDTWGEKDKKEKEKEKKKKKKKEGKDKLKKDLMAGGLSEAAAKAIVDGTSPPGEDKDKPETSAGSDDNQQAAA